MFNIIITHHAKIRLAERMPQVPAKTYREVVQNAYANRNYCPTDRLLKSYLEYVQVEKCRNGEKKVVAFFEDYIFIFVEVRPNDIELKTVYKFDKMTALNHEIHRALKRR